MIRSVLRLSAAPGRAAALEQFYDRHGVLDRAKAFPGCRDAVLLRALGDDVVTHLVIADWDGADDYQRWVDDPWRDSLSQELADLLATAPAEPVVGKLYEFVPVR